MSTYCARVVGGIAVLPPPIQSSWDYVTYGAEALDRSPQIVALREHEIALALADLDCRLSVDFGSRQTQRRIAAEVEFFSANRAFLEDLRNAAEQTLVSRYQKANVAMGSARDCKSGRR